MGFHVARKARDRYQFGDSLFSPRGHVVFASFHQARAFAQAMNAQRNLAQFPEQAVKAGQVNAVALIVELSRFVLHAYLDQHGQEVMDQALARMQEELGPQSIDQALIRFVAEYPPPAVYRREVTPEEYAAGTTGGVSNRRVILEELLMLWLSNFNPAFAPFRELFDDAPLAKETSYPQLITGLQKYFESQPAAGAAGESLIDLLTQPARAVPHSLTGQLEYILQHWGTLLGRYVYRLLGSLDLIKEEEKIIFPGGGPGPARVLEFAGMEAEPERFSKDDDWMPRLVLIAKNSYVWLDQLSRKFGRSISKLNEIPDEELDMLAHRGFSGLWMIGLWERSRASQKIKQMCGNADAVSSAYSLLDYRIAEDLGGDAAYEDLKARAWQRGIRLASDMVPNHMGIDSRWLVEHPDWFVSTDYCPFPTYTFNGVDLLEDDRVSIYLEDHYYNRSDAAVVFKRVDRWTGSEKYVYHGNDGTNMPWNDTAQLNYLNAEAREAVIRTIVHVARQFPVIRFDAAMTLAKKHYQRLWFPQPGSGGAIPSRAEHGMSREHFDELMPTEFWRDVVDRVAEEAPGTLLLAEAFWMMEGYFVRTLGMHRVYNSAFMNMLRDEENAKYRQVMKNTLEFDPEVLKRYVNFMNNPDERTAIDQFGKDDRYFGICILMATMPGLPMFGHAQVEGFAERYGMEYRRALWDEQPDTYLEQRHEREVFPLLHRRRLFAGVENFLLYDCYMADGRVNEDVFAYSNRSGDERALVIYHNRFATVEGWLRRSAAYAVKGGGLTQKTLGEGLGLRGSDGSYCIFRDQINGLEYIRNSRELCENGLFIHLDAYKYHVFLDFREVHDNEWRHYSLLAGYLDGCGVPSIHGALQEVVLEPIHRPFEELVSAASIRSVRASARLKAGNAAQTEMLDTVETRAAGLLTAIRTFINADGSPEQISLRIRQELAAVFQIESAAPRPKSPAFRYLAAPPDPDDLFWGTICGWLFTHRLGQIVSDAEYEQQSRSWQDEWLLGKLLVRSLTDLGIAEDTALQSVALIKLLTTRQGWLRERNAADAYSVLEGWLKDEEAQQFLLINRYQGTLWFNLEAFERLSWWMLMVAAVDALADSAPSGRSTAKTSKSAAAPEKAIAGEVTTAPDPSAIIASGFAIIERLRRSAAAAGFQVDRLLAGASGVSN